MNLFTPKEVLENYAKACVGKAKMPAFRLLISGILAGGFIAFGCVGTNTAVHSFSDVSCIRLTSGLLFCGGICMVILMGTELFTGNCLMAIGVADRKITMAGLLRNWIYVYIGNLIGSIAIAYACANFGQMNYSSGGLALYSMKMAAGKCAMPFGNAFVLAIFCNALVCLAVLCGLSAKDTGGRVLATVLPITFFVVSGFEHCVANMYYIPAGIFASQVPEYAAKAAEAGLDLSAMTWGNFIVRNLVPVTLGNIAGGVLIGVMLWAIHVCPAKQLQTKEE